MQSGGANKYRFDSLEIILAVFGLAVSVTTFLAQGPYDNAWQYLLPALPVSMVLIGLTSIRMYRRMREMKLSLLILNDRYNLLSAVRGSSVMHVRILNMQGDVDFERRYELELVKNVEIQSTKVELLFSEVRLEAGPPVATVVKRHHADQALEAQFFNASTRQIDGKDQHHYSWSYKLSHPLKKAGDYLSYTYRVPIRGSEAGAFSSNGGHLYVENGLVCIPIAVTLVAPSGFSIELLDCSSIDYSGARRPLDKTLWPAHGAADEVISWSPPPALGIRYVCHYKCKAKPSLVS